MVIRPFNRFGSNGRLWIRPLGLRNLVFCTLALGGLFIGFKIFAFGSNCAASESATFDLASTTFTSNSTTFALSIVSKRTIFTTAQKTLDFKTEEYFRRVYGITTTSESSIHISEAIKSQPTNGSLFCFVITAPLHHEKRVPAVSRTWLKRCDHGEIFTSSQEGLDENIPYRTLFQHLDDSYDALFWKSKLAIQYSYMQISPEFDWYMKADDDSFVIVENLKAFLATLDPSQPYYLGFRLRHPVVRLIDHGYNSGGAGYLLSRKAVEIFSTQLFTNSSICSFNIYEDVGIGKCLEEVNVYPHDTRDSEGRQMFNLFTPGKMIRQADLEAEGQEKWFYDGYLNAGFKAISPDSISFHHVSPDMMDTFEAALYHIRVRQK